MIALLLLPLLLQTSLAQDAQTTSTPSPFRSLTCSKCVSVIDSYRSSHQMIESVRRMRSELMGRCHRWSGGVITCRKVMSDHQNMQLLQASFMTPGNNPHLSCMAIKMCIQTDYDVYLKRDHANEEIPQGLPPDFTDKLKEHFKKSLGIGETNSTTTVHRHRSNSYCQSSVFLTFVLIAFRLLF